MNKEVIRPINRQFDKLAKIIDFIKSPPELRHLAPMEYDIEQHQDIMQFRGALVASGGYSERQAVATVTEPNFNPETINYLSTDFAAIQYLRTQKYERIPTITAGALLCAPSSNTLFVERRNPRAHLFPNRLSMFGGHYCLDQEKLGHGDLIDTVIHELRQEAGVDLRNFCELDPSNLPPQAVILECETGSIQYTPLCFAIPPEQARIIENHSSDEGGIEAIDLNAPDPSIFEPSTWTPMGYAVFCSWIALECPFQKDWLGPPVNSDALSVNMGMTKDGRND